MDKVSNITSCLYGVVLIAGGIIGYIQAHSRMSLVAGVFAGVLILLAAKVGSSNPKAGYLFVASISLVLAIFFFSQVCSNPFIYSKWINAHIKHYYLCCGCTWVAKMQVNFI